MLPLFFSSSRQEPRHRLGSWVSSFRFQFPPAGQPGIGLAAGRRLAAAIGAALLLTACSVGPAPGDAAERVTPPPAPEAGTAEPSDGAERTSPVDPEFINRRVTDFEARSPVRLLGLDSIPPVYNPVFATAAEAPLADDELVIGIALDGEAKAYPINVLRFREMVNDELAGLPILVTW